MPQLTNALIGSIILLLTANFVFAQSSSSCKDKSTEEICGNLEKNKVNRADSLKKYITAEYCLNYDSERKWTLDDSEKGWKLLLYKSIIPLTIKLQSKSYNYFGNISYNLDWDIQPRSLGFGSIKPGGVCSSYGNGKTYDCKMERNEEYDMYGEEFKELYLNSLLQKTDTAKISTLFNPKKSLKWNLNFEIDYQSHNLSGTHNIYISGICTEEQLKEIEKSKEMKEKSKNNVKNE